MIDRIQQLLQVQANSEGQLLAKENVIGVAVGYKESEGQVTDELAVVALVQAKKPLDQLSSADVIPKQVEGVRTDVVEVGYLKAQTARDRFRPTIPGGVSIGHYRVTAGTFGVVVRDKTTGDRLILSNNHVLANSNDASVGDVILQPGVLDGGRNPDDLVARLERFIPLRYVEDAMQDIPPAPQPNPSEEPREPLGCNVVGLFAALTNTVARVSGSSQRVVAASQAVTAMSAPVNTALSSHSIVTMPAPTILKAQAVTADNAVDAALARPLTPEMISDEIQGIGRIDGTKAPVLGMRVRKQGRTTELTSGNITLLNATINIAYDTARGPRTARFTGQVITEGMSQGGDSGALVVDGTENKAVGLLFAGSNVASVFTPIDVVLAALNVTL